MRSRSDQRAISNGFLVELMDWMPPDLFENRPECRTTSASPTGPGTDGLHAALSKYRSAGG
jgi:hypothetical protein